MSGIRPITVVGSVAKRFQNTTALDGISFAIDKGEVFGYIGPNGAGKTTTIKILVGLIQDFEGTVHVGRFRMPGEKQDASRLFGYMPQDVAFQEWKTVEQTLMTFGLLSGMKKGEIDVRIEEALIAVGLGRERKKKVSYLSGGMIQKLGFAQALLHRPSLLVLDEPLAGLDPESRYQIKSTLKDISKKGTTVFFSSHILSDVQDIAGRIGIINRGKILKIGSLAELKAQFDVTNDIAIVLSREARNIDDLVKIEGIENVDSVDSKRIHLSVNTKMDSDRVIHQVVLKIIEQGGHIRGISPISQSLDEVYMKYVRGDER
jgi:ABC-2 type transport system ATP-binding protein